MATADDYLSAIGRCKRRAEHAYGEESRAAWLNLVESYQNLLRLEQIDLDGALISGKKLT